MGQPLVGLSTGSGRVAATRGGYLHDTFETAAIGLGLISLSGHWLRVNRRLCQKLGVTAAELMAHKFADIIDPQDRHKFDLDGGATEGDSTLLAGASQQSFELRCQRKNGSWFWADVTISLAQETDGRPSVFVCSVQDIHRLKTAEEHLIVERRLMIQQLRMQSAMFNATQEGMLIISPDHHVISCNPAFSEITDYAADEIKGRHVRFLFGGEAGEATWRAIQASLMETGQWSGESWARRKGGEAFRDWTSIHALTDDSGRLLNYVLTSIDMSRIAHAPGELERLAFSDWLTGLPNRNLFMNRLNHAIGRARRNATTGAVMHIDLDGFKAVNDRYGHMTGDELLRQVAGRLKGRLREVDTVARFGGDEFLVVLEELRKPEGAGIVADALIGTLARPFSLGRSGQVNITSSIGVAMFARDAQDADSIIAEADRALFDAKMAGRSCYRLGQSGMTMN